MNKALSGKVTVKWITGLTCTGGKQSYEPISRDLHLYVSIGKAGSKSLVYRRKLHGTYREKNLGKVKLEGLDLAMAQDSLDRLVADARKKAAEYNDRVQRGENIFDTEAAAEGEPTVRELFEAYMSRHVEKSRKQVNEPTQNFERWLGSIARRKASTIKRIDAERLHKQIAKERGDYSANRAVQLGRAIFNKGIAWKLHAGENPFSGISLFEEESRNRFLSAGEAGRLINALQSLPEDDDDLRALKDFILLDLFTGVRKANLLCMRWDEIQENGDGGLWTIPDHKTKNREGQAVPLGASEMSILKSRRQFLKEKAIVSPFVFPGKGLTGHLRDNKRSWTTLRKQTGLTDITIHDLRRSVAAAMASQNVNVALIKGALNHKDMKTTLNVYARTNKQAELEARQLAQRTWLEAAQHAPSGASVKPLKKAQ